MLKKCDVDRRRDLPDQRLRQRTPTRSACASSSTRSSAPTSPARSPARSRRWPRSTARASTTVVDVFMKLIYADYADRLASGLTELGFPGHLNFADCAAQLVARDVAMAAPFRVVFSGPAAGTVSGAHFGERIGAATCSAPTSAARRCDISVVTDGQPTVNTTFELEHDLHRQRAVDRDLLARRRRRLDRLDQPGGRDPGRPGQRGRRPRPGRLRQGRRPSRR